MKIFVKMLFVVSVSLFAILFLGCNQFGREELTLENYNQYLSFDVTFEPDNVKYDILFKCDYFDTAKAVVKVNSASQFLKFHDCNLVVRVRGFCNGKEVIIDVPVKVGLGGSGSNVVCQELDETVMFGTIFGTTNYEAIGDSTYDIISISGMVEEV